MNASRIFRNFLNVSQTTEDLDLDLPLTPEEVTQVIGYLNFHYGTDENLVRAMLGTPGLIPNDFVVKYDPDTVLPSTDEVSEFLGDIHKEDVGDFLKAVAETEHPPTNELEFLAHLAQVEKPAVITSQRILKKFKGR